MNIELIESNDRKLVMRVEDSTIGVMNALRRTLMMDVPKLAIEDVTIYDNKSALFDEVVAHRLGMLPIPTDPNLFASFDPELPAQEQDETTQVLYTLTFEGPGTVRASDLKPATGEETEAVADPEVPIVKLGRDQRLMLEATAMLGTGAAHAKWQPVVACGYRELPTVDVSDATVPSKVHKELEEIAPEGAISFDGDDIVVEDEIAAHDFLYNTHDRYGIEGVEFGSVDGSFIFRFETDGALTPKQALREAIRILMDKLEETHEFASELQ